MIRYALSDDITSLKGIGSKKKEQLTAAGIETIGDLLSYYPVKYKSRCSSDLFQADVPLRNAR